MLEEVIYKLVIISKSCAIQEMMTKFIDTNKIRLETSSAFSNVLFEEYDGFIFDGLTVLPQDKIKQLSAMTSTLIATKDEMKELLSIHSNCSDLLFWIDAKAEDLFEFQMNQFINQFKKNKEDEVYQMFLNTLIDSVPDLIWFKDLRGSHLKINDAFCKAVGKTKEQCENRGHYYIWDIEPDEYADGEYVCLETEQEVIERGETCLFDEKVLSKSGLRQFKTYKSPLYDKKHRMFGTVGIAKDVTDLQNIGQEMEIILESIPFATLVVDHLGNSVYSNIKFNEYFSLTTEELTKISYTSFCENILGISVEELENTTLTEVTLSQHNKTRVYRIQQQSITDIFGNHFGHFFIALDVTKESQLQNEIIENANTDFLTGLYNRRFLYERITNEIKVKPICVVYFDLDKFKNINDTYGHQEGDRALMLMAALLQEYFEEEVVTRVGGDEFVVTYFGGFDLEKVEKEVKYFINYIEEEFKKDDHFKLLSTCAGIATNDDLNAKTDILILHADRALYEAKSIGKSQCRVYKDTQ